MRSHNLCPVSLDHVQQRNDDTEMLSLRERGVLKQATHACDRSYQHTAMGICKALTNTWLTFVPTPPTEPTDESRSSRTWQDGMVMFCDLSGKPQTGFLIPYHQADYSLQMVLNNVLLCHEFELCPGIKFLVQGRPVEQRQTINRLYGFADLQQCGPVGRLQPENDV